MRSLSWFCLSVLIPLWPASPSCPAATTRLRTKAEKAVEKAADKVAEAAEAGRSGRRLAEPVRRQVARWLEDQREPQYVCRPRWRNRRQW